MTIPGERRAQRRTQVLIVTRETDFLDRWTDLCAKYHCSVFHVSPRPDGQFRNLSMIDFDIAILSLDSPSDLAHALNYIEDVSPHCVVIPCSPSREEMGDVPSGSIENRVIPLPPGGKDIEDAFTLALKQLRERSEALALVQA